MFLLKSIRVAVALLIFFPLSVLFLDFSDTVPRQLHVLTHIQLIPALLSHTVAIVVFWFALTLLFGRIYCSAVCPFGILQDMILRITRWIRGKNFRFHIRSEMKRTRYTFLGLFLIGLAGLPMLVSLLDPYSHFGRMMTWIFRPPVIAVNNMLAGHWREHFHVVPNYVSGIACFVAVAVFLLTAVLAMFAGRRYCNTICPLGTLLGIISKYSIIRVHLKENCKSCGLCEKNCKGECIDALEKKVDSSRCVACFNCLSVCKINAIGYGWRPAVLPSSVPESGHGSRRSLLSWSVLALLIPSTVRAESNSKLSNRQSEGTNPSLPRGRSTVGYVMNDPILPPGANDLHRYRKHCSACHLCVTKCPANVLTPAATELGLAGFLQPIVKFKYGFCSYDCTICGVVCPSHAIHVLSKEQKHRVQIGEVVFLKENCVVHTQETSCGACAEHCPTGAIEMVPIGDSSSLLTIPQTDTELCIGCGACEYICPVTPYRAIYVRGLAKQGEAKPAYDPNEKQQEVKLDDFGF